MDRTPERPARPEAVTFAIATDDNRSPRRSSRIKKNPSVTPKRFTKFFTPRLRSGKHAARSSRKALRELSATNLNNRSERPSLSSLSIEGDDQPPTKKRKLSFASISSIPSSPIKVDRPSSRQESVQFGSVLRKTDAVGAEEALFETEDEDDEEEEELCELQRFPPRVVPYWSTSTSAGLLSRQLGRRTTIRQANDSFLWQHEAANFHSLPEDVLTTRNQPSRSDSLPFCAASFNHNDFVAIGDEDGAVRVYYATERESAWDHHKIHMTIYPHDNAIMDMEVSADDTLLATASGDQTCRIIDVNKAVATHTLTGHMGSIKRVQWQPSSGNNVLATCSRDGNVCLWDLRASSAVGTLFNKELRRASPSFLEGSLETKAKVEIRDAHSAFDKSKNAGGKRQVKVSSRTDFAVTTCAFVSDTRPHLLATASEHNAIIKLWDMRALYKQRTGRAAHVSATVEPKNHETVRPFGVTSIAMSSDGSRLYSLCRDHTVYAYSTAHLILGGSAGTSSSSVASSRSARTSCHGLGPLYGFRHPALRLGSFYEKLAVRHQTEENTEMIATGTGDECAVLFPTDERYLNQAATRRPPLPAGLSAATPRLRLTQRTPSALSVSTPSGNDGNTADGECPIYYNGTALVNGHKKEVTAVAWVPNGKLITTADDYTARSWHEDAQKARSLRLNTERDPGKRQCGWAAVREGFDDDEDED